MADLKISQLTASTTPLAGTEVLPVVQSGVTKQVSVADLTAGRAVSAASVTASTGSFIVGTSGQGIDFSATPGTGSSELLNDYEEGTFTATYKTTGAAPTITYLTQAGRYTKIGRVVFFTIEMTTLAIAGGSGTLSISGLPFTIAERYSCNAYASYWYNWTTAAPITGVGFVGTTSMDLYSDNPTTTALVPIANLTNGGVYLYLSGSYLT